MIEKNCINNKTKENNINLNFDVSNSSNNYICVFHSIQVWNCMRVSKG